MSWGQEIRVGSANAFEPPQNHGEIAIVGVVPVPSRGERCGRPATEAVRLHYCAPVVSGWHVEADARCAAPQDHTSKAAGWERPGTYNRDNRANRRNDCQ